MTTVFSTLKHSDNVGLGTDGQQQTRQNRQIYSEIFSNESIDPLASDYSPNTDVDFGLSDILKRAVNTVRERCNLDRIPMYNLIQNTHVSFVTKMSTRIKKQSCSLCQKWVHRKCSGISVREYEALVDEDDSISWQCILSVILKIWHPIFHLVTSLKLNFMICMVWIFLHNYNCCLNMNYDQSYLIFQL